MIVYLFNIWLIESLYVWFTSTLMLCLYFDCLVYGTGQFGHNVSVSFQFCFLLVYDPEDNESKTINSNDRPQCHRMIILGNSKELKEVCLNSKCKTTLPENIIGVIYNRMNNTIPYNANCSSIHNVGTLH